MRPAGEVRMALLRAAHELATPDCAPTLREMAHRAQVGLKAARETVAHMRRGGTLCIARTRKVPYRNRPVAEYVPRAEAPEPGPDRHALHSLLCSWPTAPVA
ncbi:hypothetical protein CKY39_16140 [Variovorax boronicumulans]|uniref:Helix-turn-helix domain-containing protein n=2 Tax=Variovorax boronicumulans TaxID=436515 RepID=A0A250DJL8_9BURK|nr:hypothetical protein CKY39_16140 [Variovorax boronicumulans]